MKTCVISVGVGQWKEYTVPLMESVGINNRACHFIHVENGDTVHTIRYPSTRPDRLYFVSVFDYNRRFHQPN